MRQVAGYASSTDKVVLSGLQKEAQAGTEYEWCVKAIEGYITMSSMPFVVISKAPGQASRQTDRQTEQVLARRTLGRQVRRIMDIDTRDV